MRIIGIDPGIAIVGYGIIDYVSGKFRPVHYGSIETPANTPVEDRLQTISDVLGTLLKAYRPEHMAIEELFWNTNQKTGIVVAEARGVILLSAKQHGIPIHEYTPLQVKQGVVGYGRAEKAQVIRMVTSILDLKVPPKPDDTADALAMAICHAYYGTSSLKNLLNI